MSNKIAVLTSGGDAPGMNACIRAVVRRSLDLGLNPVGVLQGYAGMISGNFIPLSSDSVSGILNRGGTILKSARCKSFYEKEGRTKAANNLIQEGINKLIVIGGDGTFSGGQKLLEEHDIQVIGVPGTIDNDLFGTDFTIGYDTAVNTVVDSIDKIRDTAFSHDRLFIVEVMGRDAGFIALRSGIATGAEAVLIPETESYIPAIIEKLKGDREKHRHSGIIVVAEGDELGGAEEVASKIKEQYAHFDIRVTILGHIQRGGNPTAMDRVLASRLGVGAVDALHAGINGVMIGSVAGEISHVPFEQACKHHKSIKKSLLSLAEILV